MEVQCKQCKEFREVSPKRDTRTGYEKRRPVCGKCGHKNRLKTLGGHAPNWRGGRHINNKGYVRVWIGPGSKYEHEHHRVWVAVNGSIPTGYIIHHKDGNKQNNDISNLECMPKPEHDRLNPMIRYAQLVRWGHMTLKEARKKVYAN